MRSSKFLLRLTTEIETVEENFRHFNKLCRQPLSTSTLSDCHDFSTAIYALILLKFSNRSKCSRCRKSTKKCQQVTPENRRQALSAPTNSRQGLADFDKMVTSGAILCVCGAKSWTVCKIPNKTMVFFSA